MGLRKNSIDAFTLNGKNSVGTLPSQKKNNIASVQARRWGLKSVGDRTKGKKNMNIYILHIYFLVNVNCTSN